MTPKMELYERVTDVLGSYDVHPDDREKIRTAFEQSDSWDAMPADIKALIEEIEGQQRQSWDDPSDVPEEILNP